MSPLVRASALTVVALGLGAAALWWSLPRGRAPGRTLLLTGFGPFAGYETNPSWQVAQTLDGTQIGDLRVVAARLDVTYGDAPRQLRAAIRLHDPDLVLSLGVAPTPAIRLERLARNRDVSLQPDNADTVHTDTAIREGGAETIPTRLPIEQLRRDLEADRFEVVLSDDAGGYLCNHVFYRLLDELDPSRTAGFVHVPPLEAPWSAARLEAAVRRIVATLAAEAAGEDGGAAR